MFSRRKPLAALAGVTAALAIAVPAASASAATSATPTVDPTVCQLLSLSEEPFGPSMFLGGGSLRSVLTNAGSTVGCAAPAPGQGLFPGFPGQQGGIAGLPGQQGLLPLIPGQR
jgi:hypothetical protein